MGVLLNIYCIPAAPLGVPWSQVLGTLVDRALVRAPFRSGTPFRDDSKRSGVLWPENWIVPETIRATSSSLPLRDYGTPEEALAYVQNAADATVTMDSPGVAFQTHPDRREFSAALALYRFREPVHFCVGVPEDFSDVVGEFPELAEQPKEPRWQGTVTELLWLHGKCVPPREEFLGSPLHELLESTWPTHLLLADEFL